jgi:hypothetical protein
MAISFLSWHDGPVVVLGLGALGVIDELAPRMALELASEALNAWECVLRADAPSNRRSAAVRPQLSVEDWGPTIDLTGIKSLVRPIENHTISLFLLSNFFLPPQHCLANKGIVRKEVFERP